MIPVTVYRSKRRPDTYLLVRTVDALTRVPEALLQHFGEPQPSFEFELEEGRHLVRAEANEVRVRLEADGYYLQLPPLVEELNA